MQIFQHLGYVYVFHLFIAYTLFCPTWKDKFSKYSISSYLVTILKNWPSLSIENDENQEITKLDGLNIAQMNYINLFKFQSPICVNLIVVTFPRALIMPPVLNLAVLLSDIIWNNVQMIWVFWKRLELK